MGKDMFVTSGLCRIREQIAASSKKSASSSEDGSPIQEEEGNAVSSPGIPASAPQKEFDFETLSPEAQRALIQREEEFERFRREVMLRIHEMDLASGSNKEKALETIRLSDKIKTDLEALRRTMEALPEISREESSYRRILADNCRTLDRVRMEMLDIKLLLEEERENKVSSGIKANLFAELDSVTFAQIFRVACAFFLPLIGALLLGLLLLGILIILTFRVSL